MKGRHRICGQAQMGPMQIETIRGMGKHTVPQQLQVLQQTSWASKCLNKDMPHETPEPPYWWDSKLKVRCIDWRFRYKK